MCLISGMPNEVRKTKENKKSKEIYIIEFLSGQPSIACSPPLQPANNPLQCPEADLV